MLSFYEQKEDPFLYEERENMDFPAHLHKQVELLFVLDGEILVQSGEEEGLLQTGGIFLVFPNVVHSYRTPANSRTHLFIFDPNLTGDYARLFYTHRPETPFLPEGVPEDAVRAIEILARDGSGMDPRLRKGYLQVVTGRLFPLLALQELKSDGRSGLVERALSDLTAHFREKVTLEDTARRIGASKYHLSRTFCEKIGTSFPAYLNILRIGYARGLLAGTDLPMDAVAAESGFESARTFYRAFREHCGITPGEYRKTAAMFPGGAKLS